MVYAFLISMNQESYQALLNVIRNLLPLDYGQLCIITDFEMPLMNAVQTVMPETKLMGCWFHFCQVYISKKSTNFEWHFQHNLRIYLNLISQAVIRYSKRRLNSVYHLFQSSPIAARVLRMVV